MRRTLVLLTAALALRCAGGPPPPGSFYTAPSGSEAPTPGRLLRSEAIEGDPELPPDAKAWRILYASTGLDGKPITVSGILVAPDLPAPLAGRPVVAWAHPTTGVADRCAPSLRKEVFDTIPHLAALVALDYVVVATDYPGLGTPGTHPYLVGESEGRAVLDGVRAARELPAAGAGTRFVAWGHSQGGQAALFAGELAAAYAPDLTLAGIAAIAPATDLTLLLQDDIAGRAGRLIAGYSLWSWSRVYGADLEGVVTASTVPVLDRMSGDCIATMGEVYRAVFDSLTLHPDFIAAGAWDTEPWRRLLEENRPGLRPTGAPLLVAQGQEDEIVRPSVTADFVAGLCRRGENVRLDSLPGVDHVRAARASATAAIQWMRDRLEGEPAKSGCAAITY